ncbi:hypothetical protein KSP40_PGU014401 [Platanthera guangdongensis]|uniref:cysteine--tRNA ligase n=1 Tax=Platanthera guangdongensis TaxID=2320717 RepID=A0ABR2MSR1_9ASPA
MEKPKLQIFNSMSKQKEVFKPIEEGKVSMYVCGVTPYDFSHIGHARAYVAFDVLHRYLKYLGYEVKYVRNFTDIDDKIIRRANEKGENPLSLSNRFSEEFLYDMAELNCLPPTHEPRVSDSMDQIKDLITQIMENGHAYTIEGDVYFSVDTYPNYYCLSGRKPDDNRAGGGGRVAVDSRKRNPADFALWKAAKPGEPSWESPWGPGRPGWHIECSAMSLHHLNHCFDIHGGGKDLIFPHHENEIAQSRAACPLSNVNFWMHNGFVNRDNQKMSKSDNNFFTIRDIEKFHAECLASMSDDLHTTTVIDDLVDLLKSINGALKKFKGKKTAAGINSISSCIEKEVKDVLGALGLFSLLASSEVLQQLKDKALKRAGFVEEEIQQKIEERNLARKNKEYEKSDKIREELYLRGISLMDEPKGTIGDHVSLLRCIQKIMG